jgi:putative glycosyltransferase (TIGR04348 family)
MRIGIVTPAPPRSHFGNRVTALRWARLLRTLGHRIALKHSYEGEPYDVLIALHAWRSYPAIRCFAQRYPARPVVVALTGTDLYRDLRRRRDARKSLELAARLITLQPKALDELPPRHRRKACVIFQSARAASPKIVRSQGAALRGSFDVCVIAHLRPVKDPLRAALAARKLPQTSRIRVLHLGAAMTPEMTDLAAREATRNPRYRWLGEQPHWRVLQILARSRLCVLSSRLEGGANALSEALVNGTPVLASKIPGSIGILGEKYPGYFRVGDTEGLARLLRRAETDGAFLARLKNRCARRASFFDSGRERAAWVHLLNDLGV